MMYKIICQAGHESYTSHPQQKTCSHGYCARPIRSIDGKIVTSIRGGYHPRNTQLAMHNRRKGLLQNIRNQESNIEYHFKQIREARERIETMKEKLTELSEEPRDA